MRGKNMLKRKRPILIFAILIVVLVLELLPYGAVLNFANTDGEELRTTYSYFDLTPYGYANFGPFVTAILTCILLVVSFVSLLADNCKLKAIVKIVSGVASVTSLAPLFVDCYSIIGGFISFLLFMIVVIPINNNGQ